MPFVNQKEYAKLLARVDAIEEKLGLAVEIPNIEYVVSLHDIYGDELLEIKGLGPATVKRIRKVGKE